MPKFVVRYKGSTPSNWGVEHIEADTPEALLKKARELSVDNRDITLIQYVEFGNPRQIWNGERAQRTGEGWYEEVLREAFPGR